MADMETALRARLIANDAVGALIGERIAWTEQPQGTPLPSVTLLNVSDPRPEHLKGYDAGRATRVQADCRAATFGAALSLARAVIAAVAQPGTFSGHVFGRSKAEGPRALNEDVNDTTIHRQSVDLIIWHVGD